MGQRVSICLPGAEVSTHLFAYHAELVIGLGVIYVVPALNPVMRMQRQVEPSRTSALSSILPWPKCSAFGERLRD
jgi:hypothetical protein